ncbi:helix-turn-helix domain-containing protein [Streptomyces marincola]|nr:helix-turn-helix transcriptional regulator [Streptomyces marincola]
MSFAPEAVRLAMSAKGWSLRRLARAVPIDPSHLSRILSGKRPVPDHVAAALTVLLDLDDDTARIAYVMANPTRLDAAAVKVLATALAVQRREDDIVGPRPLLPAAQAHRRSLLALLRDARGPQRDPLCAVVSEAVQFCGWLHIEEGDYSRAVPLLNEAVELADDIGNGSLVAQALNMKGNVARQKGNWTAVHRWFVGAYMSETSRRQRVVNGAQAASALAAMGRRRDAEKLLDECETLREKAAQEAVPGAAYWLTAEWMSLPLGHVYLSLGNHGQAAEHLRHGLDSLPPEHRYALWTREARGALAEAENGA